jgi:hypothetical protein
MRVPFHKPGSKFINTEYNEISVTDIRELAGRDVCFFKIGLITKFNKTKLSNLPCYNTTTVLPYDGA